MKRLWTTRAQKLAALQATQTGTSQSFYLPPIGDYHLNLRISRNTTIAIIVSILLHALVLFFVLPELIKPNATPAGKQTITITLGNPESKPVEQAPPPEPKSEIKPKKTAKKEVKIPKVMATKAPPTPNQSIVPIAPPKPTETLNTKEPPVDMMALVNANRQKRGETTTTSTGVAEDPRDAIIKKNLAQQGTNGIFQIKEIGLHTAQFTFKGWKNNYNAARLELIDVQAAANESIERAIVKKMIVIIRKDYSGDFHWLSPRYGDVVKSARLEDNAELEQFLLDEFFPNRTFR